jgi:hypothetical protein
LTRGSVFWRKAAELGVVPDRTVEPNDELLTLVARARKGWTIPRVPQGAWRQSRQQRLSVSALLLLPPLS